MKRAFTVGRQEHSKDPGSGRREPLCHVAGFGVNVVAGRRLGSQALAQVPVLAGKWELMAGMKSSISREPGGTLRWLRQALQGARLQASAGGGTGLIPGRGAI